MGKVMLLTLANQSNGGATLHQSRNSHIRAFDGGFGPWQKSFLQQPVSWH